MADFTFRINTLLALEAWNATGTPPPPSGGGGGTPAATQLTPPTLESAGAPTQNQVTLMWDTVAGAGSYQLLRGTTASLAGATVVYAGPAINFSDGGLQPSTTYYWGVKALVPTGSALLDSAVSNVVTVTTPAAVIIAPYAARLLQANFSTLSGLNKEAAVTNQFTPANGADTSYTAAQLPAVAVATKLGGNFTSLAPKPPLNLKFPAAVALAGLGPSDSYRALAEYYDYTKLRNFSVSHLANLLLPGLMPKMVRAELTSPTTGEYFGYYTFSERAKRDSGIPKAGVTYVLQTVIDNQISDADRVENLHFKTPRTTNYEGPIYNGAPHSIRIEYPGADKITPAQTAEVQASWLKVEAAFDLPFEDPNGIQALVDLDSFIYAFLVDELGQSRDTISHSHYMFFQGGKWRFLLWDKDQWNPALDAATAADYKANWASQTYFYRSLLQQDSFQQAVRARMKVLHAQFPAFVAWYSAQAQYLQDTGAADRDATRWNMNSLEYAQDIGRTTAITGHAEMVTHFRSYAENREPWLNFKLGDNYFNAGRFRYPVERGGGHLALPALTGIKSVRLAFLAVAQAPRLLQMLLDLGTGGLGNYSVGINNGPLAGFSSHVRVWEDGQEVSRGYDANLQAQRGEMDRFFDGDPHTLYIEFDAPQNASPVIFGRVDQPNDPAYNVLGWLGTVEFYGRNLTPAEQAAPQAASGLLARYAGESDDYRTAYDSSGNGKDATLHGLLPNRSIAPTVVVPAGTGTGPGTLKVPEFYFEGNWEYFSLGGEPYAYPSRNGPVDGRAYGEATRILSAPTLLNANFLMDGSEVADFDVLVNEQVVYSGRVPTGPNTPYSSPDIAIPAGTAKIWVRYRGNGVTFYFAGITLRDA